MSLTQPPKILVKLSENVGILAYILDEWKGYPERFSFSQVLEISWQYLLDPSNSYFPEKSLTESSRKLSNFNFHWTKTGIGS